MASPTARKFRKQLTEAELKLWRALQALDLTYTHFRRQVPIGPYIADFACHTAKLIVEVDGGQHGEPIGQLRDVERSAFLESRGYKVLRFWNIDVLQEMESVIETILAELRERTR
ncbi:MAG: DUF559 domain-containing protein [Alphaproteobacteria bacterium]